ncbi:MAG: glycoside hydrolase family 5 protein [Chloroflexota bacterium]|nr:glycoside hydrolase family 5 protein [Chloroflexota bacterium]
MSVGMVALVLFGLLAAMPTASVSAASDYYADTGHYLYGQFRDYWNGNGGLLQYGFPITKVFDQQSEDGKSHPTQYLQRAVFEQHAENKGTPFEVLGRRLSALQTTDRAKTDPNFQIVGNPNDGRLWFTQTNHTIGGNDPGNTAIRAFWEKAGNGDIQRSVQIFGYPVSEPFDEQNPPVPAGDGQTHRVQYFERYRLEYHPENANPFKVLLGLLGVTQADKDNLDPARRAPEPAGQPQPDCIGQGPCGAGGGQPLQRSYANVHVGDNHDGYAFNVDAIGLDGGSKDTLFGKVSDAQFGWIRQQVRWSSYEPAKGQFGNNYVAQLDALINAAAAKGVNVMLSPVSSPDWVGAGGGLPKNPQDFADFIGFMANRYKGKVAAYEVWNEQNYAVETGGQVNVGAYIPILKAGYQTLKASDPNITVVFGGMTPTGVTGHPEVALDDAQYLQQIYAINNGEVKKYYDVLGAHPGSNCNPPDNSYPDNPATNACGTDPDGGRSFTKDNSFYFKRIVQLRNVMEQNGEAGKKMWLTEFGWDSNPTVVPGYEYSPYVSEDQQAQYLTRAFDLGKSYSWMGVMFVWNLNFQVTTSGPSDEKYGWGVLHNDWSPRPSYTALKNMAK